MKDYPCSKNLINCFFLACNMAGVRFIAGDSGPAAFAAGFLALLAGKRHILNFI